MAAEQRSKPLNLLLTFTLILLFCRTISSKENSLTIELPDKEQWCFGHEFPKAAPYIFSFKVLRGGNNDVDVKLTTPNGRVIYNEKRRHEGRIEMDTTTKGAYKFCFSNDFSTVTHKVIFFSIRSEEVENLAVEKGVRKPYAPTATETACDNIHANMAGVVENQKEYRLKEAIGRHLAEVLNAHVLWWSIGQTAVIFLAGVGQVIVLKTFFTEKLTSSKPTDKAQFGFPRR